MLIDPYSLGTLKIINRAQIHCVISFEATAFEIITSNSGGQREGTNVVPSILPLRLR